MKKVVFLCLAMLSGSVGLVALVNLLYNIAGLFRIQDAADGPKWELIVAIGIFFTLTLVATYFCYRMIRGLRLPK